MQFVYTPYFSAHHTVKWLVAGFGPQGAVTAAAICKNDPQSRLMIVDPNPKPLAIWEDRNNQMQRDNYGRPWEGCPFFNNVKKSVYPYHEDQVETFIQTIWRKIQRYKLQRLHTQAKVLNVVPNKQGGNKQVLLSNGDTVEANYVVLSLGFEKTNWPAWAQQLKEKKPQTPIYHSYDPDFNLEKITQKYDTFVVVGGGWTALRLTELLAQQKPGKVTLLSKTNLVSSGTAGVEVDPCWLKKGACYKRFHNSKKPAIKEHLLRLGQPAGLTDAATMEIFQHYLKTKQVSLVKGDIQKVDYNKRVLSIDYETFERTKNGHLPIKTTCIILATGFNGNVGGTLFEKIKHNFGLSTTTLKDNYTSLLPKLEKDSEWGKGSGIYITGLLARGLEGLMAGRLPGTLMTTARLMESEPIKNARKKIFKLSA